VLQAQQVQLAQIQQCPVLLVLQAHKVQQVQQVQIQQCPVLLVLQAHKVQQVQKDRSVPQVQLAQKELVQQVLQGLILCLLMFRYKVRQLEQQDNLQQQEQTFMFVYLLIIG
jgi:hypothetical protein